MLTATLDELGPGPLQNVRVTLTTRCNLRCVYCATSQPSYRGTDIEPAALESIAAELPQLGRNISILVNGHGETTIADGWQPFCRSLIESGMRLEITTNLAKTYSPDEIDTLARFINIQVSIDSFDPALNKALRRKTSIAKVIDNIQAIREAAIRHGGRKPAISISCGLYDRSALQIEDFARAAIKLKIDYIIFWTLVKYPDVPDAENVRPLEDLDLATLRPALIAIDQALNLLKAAGIPFDVAGNFLVPLARKAGLS